jgi:threonine synthase
MKNQTKFAVIKNLPQVSEADEKYYSSEVISYDYDHVGTFPLPEKTGMEKYLPLLPIDKFHVDILGIGDTRLVKAKKYGITAGLSNLYIKMESENPTGSIKDRFASVVISAAIEQDHKMVYVVSSGNAAVATAKYAKEAGISCTCYVPEKTYEDKKLEIASYGARIVTVPGFYEDVYRMVVDLQTLGWNVTCGQNAFWNEGAKTVSFEIFEQLGYIPDVVVVPSGNGGCFTSIWKGFRELKQLGLSTKLPQMISVQIEGAAPINAAFEKHQVYTKLDQIDDSIADGIVAKESYNSPAAIEALKESGGYTITVNDAEIIAAMKALKQKENILPEPTAASAFAALPKLRNGFKDSVVVINTGDGKKMKNNINHLLNI